MGQTRAALVGAALALAAACLVAVAADEPTSGLPVGAGTPPFQVQDVTGPAKGGKLCYI